MDIKLRKIIYKMKFIHELCIDIVQNQNNKFYQKIKNEYYSIRNLPNNIRRHDRCFIVGNGPSLNIRDLDSLASEDCFAANLIFNIFPKTIWRPRYYCIQDRYARIGNFLEKNDIPFLFVGDYFWRTRGCNNKRAYCFHTERIEFNEPVKFSLDIKEKLYDSYTITYIMIQLAIYMGYREIYLLGIDHNYPFTLDESGKPIINVNAKEAHFFKDDRPDEVIANVFMMEKAYRKAKEVADSLGIKIYNATRGGKLEIFERKSIESIR